MLGWIKIALLNLPAKGLLDRRKKGFFVGDDGGSESVSVSSRVLAIPSLLGFFMILNLILVSACQTSVIHQFDLLQPGMEKNEVLALVGSPSQTKRFKGKDRWFYNFYDNQIHFRKEIQFFEGVAIYIGEPWQSPETAESVDARNDKMNQQVDADILKEKQEDRHRYENFEAKSKGQDRVHYLPVFELIR